MRVLIVKTSSLGDVLHTLPALTDASNAIPGISFDWVVEEAFAEIPAWHHSVANVIPVAIRRWRKTPFKSLLGNEWREFFKKLRAQQYDYIIDAQGLLKSAILARMARGTRFGLDKQSLTEPLARFFYQKFVKVDLQRHAVLRMRTIFSQALGYELLDSAPDFGIDRQKLIEVRENDVKYIVFLHGTTWATKLWPDAYWAELAMKLVNAGYNILIPWGNEIERQRASELAKLAAAITILPRFSLTELAKTLAGAQAVVSVDTGLGHLAAALGVPNVSLYGPTNPGRVGTVGQQQLQLVSNYACRQCDKQKCTHKEATTYAACMRAITPAMVYEQLKTLIKL